MLEFPSGFQLTSSRTSCSLSQLFVIVVTLPMSKAEFLKVEDKYIESVAETAGVVRENVQIVSINEIFTRASKRIAIRRLLATSVRVRTSILLASGQKTQIQDQSVLNTNLNKYSLPSGTVELDVMNTSTAVPSGVSITTPVPVSSGSSAGSNVPMLVGIIVGAAVGVIALISGLRYHMIRRKKTGPENKDKDPGSTAHIVIQVLSK
jgi:hypothetical protein